VNHYHGAVNGINGDISNSNRHQRAAHIFRTYVAHHDNDDNVSKATASTFDGIVVTTPSVAPKLPSPSLSPSLPAVVGHIPEPHFVDVLPTAPKAQHTAEWWSTKTPDEAVRLLFDPQSGIGYADVQYWNDDQ
jgi:hypothetical protein